MYTYNPHWGSSLVASREATKRLPRTPFFYPQSWFVISSLIYLFIYSFSHQFLVSPYQSVAPMVPKAGPEGRQSLWKRLFWPLSLFSRSFFNFLPRIPVPPFHSLRSFVIFGWVSDTLVCLGNRVEGLPRIAVQGSEDTWRVHIWTKKDDKGEQKDKVDKVTHWNG